MKANDVFSSKYLNASDLRGRDVVVTIDHVEIEKMPSGEKKPALFFQGKDKALLLNRTNFNTISELLSADDTDNWVGSQITIYPTETDFQGKVVDCIRVRRKRATAAHEWQAPEQPPEPPAGFDDSEDSIPF